MDRFLTMGGLVTISLPEFVTGVVMILILSSTLGMAAIVQHHDAGRVYHRQS